MQSTQITIRHRKILQNVKSKNPPADEIEAINTKKTLNNRFLIIISFLPLIL